MPVGHARTRMIRLLFTLLAAATLLVSGAAAGVWAHSYRAGYAAVHTVVEQRNAAWVTTTSSASLRPSCVYLECAGPREAWPVSVMLPGPQGETFEVFPDPPTAGWRTFVEPAFARWDAAFDRRLLDSEALRFAL